FDDQAIADVDCHRCGADQDHEPDGDKNRDRAALVRIVTLGCHVPSPVRSIAEFPGERAQRSFTVASQTLAAFSLSNLTRTFPLPVVQPTSGKWASPKRPWTDHSICITTVAFNVMSPEPFTVTDEVPHLSLDSLERIKRLVG